MLLRRFVRMWGVTLGVVALAGLSGCDSGTSAANVETSASPSATAAAPAGPTYVALGDSYTAAPGVPTTEQESGCLRSSGNYPSLVAAALGRELVDVSCSGASTPSLVEGQRVGDGTAAPQLDALTPDTSLVTLGVGGNDLDLSRAIAFHPFAAEQQAVADLVVAKLGA